MKGRKIKEQLLENKMFDALAYIQKIEGENELMLSCVTTIRHGTPSGPISTVYLSEYEMYKITDLTLSKLL